MPVTLSFIGGLLFIVKFCIINIFVALLEINVLERKNETVVNK